MVAIDQPNLTCTYAVTISPGQDLRVLTVINKDPYPLSDADVITALKTWSESYKKYLDDTKQDVLRGQCNVTIIPTKSPKATCINFVSFCEDEESIPNFNDFQFYQIVLKLIEGLEKSLTKIGD